jgi:6-pyruvoyltetrahydropterin/6-carboxytetrahydropterin synthase
MHKLARKVRFSISPFLAEDSEGFNSFASRPAGEGLSLFFEMNVELAGPVDAATGFVVNVADIDRCVRQYVVGIFAKRIREDFGRGRHISFSDLSEILRGSWEQLADKFGAAKLTRLSLALNPFRRITVEHETNREDCTMVHFTERFEFAATHKLWNDKFSEERNFEIFGKCANPTGHGHNYAVEVTVKRPLGSGDFSVSEFEKTVNEEMIKVVDHKNLNTDVAEFKRINPTVENIAVFAWRRLVGKFGQHRKASCGGVLHCITVWETEKTYCCYYGEEYADK